MGELVAACVMINFSVFDDNIIGVGDSQSLANALTVIHSRQPSTLNCSGVGARSEYGNTLTSVVVD